ncbi:MAG: ATP phosphoribosyltransferase regulatory subunit [Alphaproteobacteria bacterium]|nr:ATP phosphoribosyltransferase regulatory subunit [Alphaproteobacteria bacterium]
MPLPPADPEQARRALLPAGLRDGLPPHADRQAAATSFLMAAFGRHGYERVDPPLVEFEESLLGSDTGGIGQQTFRLLDPLSQRMMGLRADMTVQVARIATTRLAGTPRPLRLAYAGDVLRMKGSQLRPERQFVQVGVELIGAPGVAADVEVMRLAATSLAGLGVPGLSIDFNAPTLVGAICAEAGVRGRDLLLTRAALDRKDADAVRRHAGAATDALLGLLAATGPAEAAELILTSLALPASQQAVRARLSQAIGALREAVPEVQLTVDPVEHRGFEYYSGIGFTLFARGVTGELGRGGRYLAGPEGHLEPATGFSLFMDPIMAALPAAPAPRRLLLPYGTPHAQAESLREDGWITLAALDRTANPEDEAHRLGCSHVMVADGIVALPDQKDTTP